MRIRCLFLSVLFCICSCVSAQDNTLKQQALDAFKAENYPQALQLLEKAVKKGTTDPEVYYYLGFFTHYAAYDSRPLAGYDSKYSDKIFRYLEKALELKPDYGDAKYFYGAECSANNFLSMQRYDAEGMVRYAQKAFDIGAYPPWLVEWGRNFLNSLEPDAIVFTGGNADFDICMYLQLCLKMRNDVTVLPIGNIDRPWYVAFIKKGLKGAVRSVAINLTDDQIVDIHPFKWRAQTLSIPVPELLKKHYQLPKNYTMDWALEPDFTSERMHSKIESDSAIKRTYLSPQRAMLAHIIEYNYQNRPIYFSNGCLPVLTAGLMPVYTKNCGLVSRLLPIKTGNATYDYNALSALLTDEHLKDYKDIVKNDIPRISNSTAGLYLSSFVALAQHYKRTNEKDKLNGLITIYKKYIKIGWNEEYENEVLKELEK